MPHYDTLIYIGRFQPFHRGHLHMVQGALAHADHLIILCGSADAARSSRNPWTVAEREAMIRAALTAEENLRITLRPIHDDPYHDGRWVAQVSRTVADVLAARGTADATVALYGYEKDASSYYLRLFPQWGYLGAPRYRDLSATPLRERYFLLTDGEDWHEPALPPAVEAALHTFRGTAAYRYVAAETRYVHDYKQSWAASPYPPIFVTVDNLITCDGHILLVERGGQPGCGLLALPGGFLNPDETLLTASLRELHEETGLRLDPAALIGVRTADRPDRSAIGRVITHVHRYHLDGTLPPVQAADDAAKACWYPLTALRRDCFHDDHYHLIRDALAQGS